MNIKNIIKKLFGRPAEFTVRRVENPFNRARIIPFGEPQKDDRPLGFVVNRIDGNTEEEIAIKLRNGIFQEAPSDQLREDWEEIVDRESKAQIATGGTENYVVINMSDIYRPDVSPLKDLPQDPTL